MDENEVLDASAIDEMDDFDLTGELDDSDYEQVPAPEQRDEPSSNTPQQSIEPLYENEDDDDITSEVLRLKGITNPGKIKFEDESGALVERSWNDLTRNEQLKILTQEGDPETDLEDDEIAFINMLRANGMTPSQYVQALQSQTAAQIQDMQRPVYEVDNLSDDELFALDLIEKVGEDNITDKELQEALESAKENPTLYGKQISALRLQYEQLEDQQRLQEQNAAYQQQEHNYQLFSEKVLQEIEGFDQIEGQDIELSSNDMNDIANYLLTRDENGYTDFAKDLQNPQVMTTAAFWLLKGPEVFHEMQSQIQDAYKRGYNLGKSSGRSVTTPKPVLVIQPQTSSTKNDSSADAANFMDDESYLYN